MRVCVFVCAMVCSCLWASNCDLWCVCYFETNWIKRLLKKLIIYQFCDTWTNWFKKKRKKKRQNIVLYQYHSPTPFTHTHTAVSPLSPLTRLCIDWLMIAYIVLFCALLSRLAALACGSTWVTSFLQRVFWISTEVVYLQRWHGWCHMKLQLSRRKFCVHHTTMHHVTSCKAKYVRCMSV